MTVTIGFVVLVMLLGLIAYLLAQKAEYKEIGRMMFFCGLLVFLFSISSQNELNIR